MNEKTIYDSIIYGASLKGCLHGIREARCGKNVLLINSFGFPGGSITESLNCLQSKHENFPEEISSLLDSIRSSKFGVLFEDDNQILLNPEIVKYELQKMLEDSGIELLFHSHPIKIDREKKTLIAALKEGQKEFVFNKYFDAFENKETKDSCIIINLFISGSRKISFDGIKNLHTTIELNNNKYFTTVKINSKISVEDVQKVVDEISSYLQEQDARIQLLPTTYYFENMMKHNQILVEAK